MRCTALVRCVDCRCSRSSTLGAARDVPLVDAVKTGDAAAVRALLQKKADVNATELDGSTALHWAVHKDAARRRRSADSAPAPTSKAANRYGVTPLSLACTNGNARIVERLLQGRRRSERHAARRRDGADDGRADGQAPK